MINVQLRLSILIVSVCLINACDDSDILLFVVFSRYIEAHDIQSSWIRQCVRYYEIIGIINRKEEQGRETVADKLK